VDGVGRPDERRTIMETSGTAVQPPVATGTEPITERERVRKRLQDRRDFSAHVVVYLVVNAFLVAAWAITGSGYFWPAWVIAAWGVGLVLHAWETFLHRPVTEADVDAELRRRN
jgi:hypothetical protein